MSKKLEFKDGISLASDPDAITKEKFKTPDYKCIGGLMATKQLVFEVIKGAEHDPLGRALRITKERLDNDKGSGKVKLSKSTQGPDEVKVRSGDTLVRKDTKKKYVVIQASIDTADSGNPRHLVISKSSGKKYKISEAMFYPNKG